MTEPREPSPEYRDALRRMRDMAQLVLETVNDINRELQALANQETTHEPSA